MSGNETVVDLFLYENNVEIKTETDVTKTVQQDVVVKTELVPSNHFEHDYYTSDIDLLEDKIKTEDINTVQLDHTYSLLHSSENSSTDTSFLYGINDEETKLTTEEIICDFKSDLLINGNSVFKNTTIKQLIAELLSKDTHVKVLKIMGKDGKTLIISKSESGMQTTVIDYDKYKINIPIEKFKCVLEMLPFLFRRLPLITNLAESLSYKCRYPYVAKNFDEYCSWNIGRRHSSEVRQFVCIVRFLIYCILVETG